MGWTGVWATLVTALLFLNSAAAADRWDLQYFYDKNDSSLAFTDLSFSSPLHGAALGVVAGRDRQRPVLALTYDGGRNWTLVSLKEAVVSLFFSNDQTGWLAGAKNHLWKTQDGGRTWKSAAPKGVRADVLRVFFLDESRGWLLCSQKQIYSTNDGGRSWQLLEASRRPDPPDASTFYTWAAFQQETGCGPLLATPLLRSFSTPRMGAEAGTPRSCGILAKLCGRASCLPAPPPSC